MFKHLQIYAFTERFCRQYFLQEVFVRFYFLVKITAEKVSINFTGDKGFHILLLLSDHTLLMMAD